jgi:hypothetical protein
MVDTKLNYEHPLSFKPATYVCYRTEQPLSIDGIDEETAWSKAPWTDPFVDIEGDLKPKPTHNTQVKMLWDKDYFYFYAKIEEPHIWATLKQRDTVIFYDDDFEIFIDPDGDGHNYYELEVNAFNTLWDLILLRPYRADNQPKVLNYWNISDIQSAVHIEGTLNNPEDTDQFWTVEMAVPWTALGELASGGQMPETGDQWRVNFSRVDWTMDIVDGRYQKRLDTKTGKALPENNWVWSPTGYINMHMPEQWGYVQFTDVKAGEAGVDFKVHNDEMIKWALWQLYFQQRTYYAEHQQYIDNIGAMQIPELEGKACALDAQLFTTPHLFEITANSCEREGRWSIRQDGKIEFFKND